MPHKILKYLSISAGVLALFISAVFLYPKIIKADITTGLVGWWKFDEGSGTTAADLSGNNNSGTLNPLANGPTWTTGKINGALSFDGVDDYVRILDSTSLHLTNFTLSLWYKVNSWPTSYNPRLISKANSWGTMDWELLHVAWSNSIEMLVGEMNGADVLANLRYSPTTGAWHQITIIKNGTTYSLYSDGVFIGTDTSSVTWTDSDNITIGKDATASGYEFNGLIDEVRIYNRALSATEIQELYNYIGGGTPTPTPTPTPSGTPSPTPSPSGTPTPDITPPVRSSGLPSGSLPVGTTQTTLSLSTNENATCKYSTVANTTYASISNTFSTTGSANHSATITGLSNGNTYNYYIRCQDTSNNANPDDYTITFSVSTPGGGNIINAASCNAPDVQTAINSASDGDTIQIPAGACTWSAGVSINSATLRTKMVKLVGAGTDASTGTRITSTVTPAITAWLDRNLTGLEISNIRFIQNTAQTSDEPWVIKLNGNADTNSSLFRIHHCYFQYKPIPIPCDANSANWGSGNPIVVGGLNSYKYTYDKNHPYIWGLIDHCTFKNNVTFQAIDIMPLYTWIYDGDSYPAYTYSGNGAWRDWDLSEHQNSWKNVFVEDSIFDADDWNRCTSSAIMDGLGGAAYVFRHNFVKNTWIANHGFEAGERSAKWQEAYNNIFVLDTTGSYFTGGTNSRGGTGVIYNNEFYDASRKGPWSFPGLTQTNVSPVATGIYSKYIGLQYYRGNGLGITPGADPCSSRYCGTDSVVGCDNKDHTGGSDNGWICGDQIGAKKGPAEPTFTFGYRWATEPYFEWNNNYTSAVHFSIAGGEVVYVAERRDYINANSCAGHMGEPICSSFWDDVNGKKKNYTAYTYPHPLSVLAAPPDTTPPVAPTGVAVN